MDSVHHIWCPLFSQEFQDLPDGAETTLTIDITVVTDKNCNIAHVDDDKRQEKQHLLNDAVEKLNKMGIATKLVNRVHSKIVIEDEELLCVGSFNWFSATREDKYQRYDTSLVYRGEGVKNEIKAIYGSLDQRQL